MGQRLRLTGGLRHQPAHRSGARDRDGDAEATAFIVADNGSNWFFQGAPDPGWVDDDLNQLKGIPGSAFEAVDTGPVRTT